MPDQPRAGPTIEDRLTKLEESIGFAEHTSGQLGSEVAELGRRLAEVQARLRRIEGRLDKLAEGPAAGDDGEIEL